MTLAELQRATLRRLGDTAWEDIGVATTVEDGEPTVSTLAGLTEEINIAYRDAVNELDMQGRVYEFFTQDVTYAAGTQSKDLYTVLTKVPRKILWVKYYPNGDTTQEPRRVTMPHSGNRAWSRGFGVLWPPSRNQSPPQMDLTAFTLSFTEVPTQQWILQIGYAAVTTALSGSTDVPVQIPPMHHHYIALKAAFTLLGGEDGAPQWIVSALNDQREKLESDPGLNTFTPRIPGAWKRRRA